MTLLYAGRLLQKLQMSFQAWLKLAPADAASTKRSEGAAKSCCLPVREVVSMKLDAESAQICSG